MAFVFFGMKLVGFRCARRETVVARKLAVDLFGYFPRAAELAFDKGEHGDAFERGTALATADDHFDCCQGSWRGLGISAFFPRNPAPSKKLRHYIDVGAFPPDLFHEISEKRIRDGV